jgi:ribosomal protein S18 acetylase RimI-like enzyme
MKEKSLYIEIKQATPDDVFGISEVQKESWLATYPNEKYDITKEDILSEDFHSKGRIEKRIEIIKDKNSNTKFFVAKHNEKIVGYCCAQKMEGFNKIRSIYVLPDFHKNGIGKKLMSKAFEFFNNDKPVKLSVAIYNQNAIGFYKKFGFEEGQKFEHNPEGPFITGKEIPEMEMILKLG